MTENTGDWKSSAIRRTLERDDAEALKEILDQGLDPKSWFDANSEQALLSVAIVNDSARCVELLLEQNGDWVLEAPFNEDLESPLALAVEQGSDEILMLLVQGDTVARYPEDWLRAAASSLPYRARFGESSLAFLEALVQRSEGMAHLLDSAILKALRKRAAACADASTGTLGDRWKAMAERLKDAAVQLDAILKEVEQLAANCHVDRVKKSLKSLLESLPPESRRHAAGLALIYAARNEDWTFADELLEMGADCLVRTKNRGVTALMNAASAGNISMIRKLLERGADLQAREKGPLGENAIEMAASPMIRRYLEKHAARAD